MPEYSQAKARVMYHPVNALKRASVCGDLPGTENVKTINSRIILTRYIAQDRPDIYRSDFSRFENDRLAGMGHVNITLHSFPILLPNGDDAGGQARQRGQDQRRRPGCEVLDVGDLVRPERHPSEGGQSPTQ